MRKPQRFTGTFSPLPALIMPIMSATPAAKILSTPMWIGQCGEERYCFWEAHASDPLTTVTLLIDIDCDESAQFLLLLSIITIHITTTTLGRYHHRSPVMQLRSGRSCHLMNAATLRPQVRLSLFLCPSHSLCMTTDEL